MLKIKEMPRSTFYYNKDAKRDKWSVERQLICEIYHQNEGRYGYRRIQAELRNQGYVVNGKTVRKLMKELGLKCEVIIKKYRSYK